MNDVIRREAKNNKVPHWAIADMLGISEITFSRMLRHELSDDLKAEVISIIMKLAKEKEVE